MNQILAPYEPIIGESGNVNINRSNFWGAFDQGTWEQLSSNQRVDALQQLENWSARRLGREPVPLSPDPQLEGTSTNGEYHPGSKSISINPSLIERNDPFQAMATTLHEGRHAYQHQVSNGLETYKNFDPVDGMTADQNRGIWRANMRADGYYSKEKGHTFFQYRYQPIEADANNYSDRTMQELWQRYGNNEHYNQWMHNRLYNNAQKMESAKKEFGLGNNESPEEYMKNQAIEDMAKRLEAKKGIAFDAFEESSPQRDAFINSLKVPQNQDEVREYNRSHGVPDIPSQRPKGGVERERGSNDPRWNDPENDDHGKGETQKGDEPAEGNEKTIKGDIPSKDGTSTEKSVPFEGDEQS